MRKRILIEDSLWFGRSVDSRSVFCMWILDSVWGRVRLVKISEGTRADDIIYASIKNEKKKDSI